MANFLFKADEAPEPLTTHVIPPEKWDDEKLSSANTYNVPTNMNTSQIQKLILSVLQAMKDNDTSQRICKEILICCHLIRDNVSVDNSTVLKDYVNGALDLKYGQHLPLKRIRRVLRETEELRDMTPEEKALAPEDLRALGLEESPIEQGKIKVVLRNYVDEEVDDDLSTLVSSMDQDDITFYIFAISFVSKVISKSGSNLTSSWQKMHDTYANFYTGRKKGTKIKVPAQSWFEGIKSSFHTDIVLTRSLIRLVVHLETSIPPETSTAGMIRYLFCMQLSYAGMHAYKLFNSARVYLGMPSHVLLSHLVHPTTVSALKTISEVSQRYSYVLKLYLGMPSHVLLSHLVHPTTVSALKTISEILQEYERTVKSPSRTPTFKYARLVGPQYFQNLQTKSCPALVYCLIQIVKKYEDAGNSFNPDSIYGIKTLGSEIKEIMMRFADKLFHLIPPSGDMTYSDLMKEATFEGRGEQANPESKKEMVDPFK
ncbi:TPA_asm: N [Artemisia betacytorhabdovirus 1]|nr:TPA_asm: N [Artemisia betacytorhabdovirus 1]